MLVVSKSAFRTKYNARLARRAGNGDTLINCLAYIDLNPIRAKMVEKPEQYRWSSIGYHVQRNNEDGFLSLDSGLSEFAPNADAAERLRYYRRYVYEKGKIDDIEMEEERDFKLNEFDRFRYRTRYFADSGIIGSKEYVNPSARPAHLRRSRWRTGLDVERYSST